MAPMPPTGALYCLASAAAFGAMGIFGKLAYDEGATVGTLLATRFMLAAVLLWILAAHTGAARRLLEVPRRDVTLALLLGALGYGAQAGAYFAALERLDASLLSLLVYTFPVMVTLAALALGRERASAGASPRPCCSARRASCWSSPGRAPAPSTRLARPLGSRRRWSTARTSWPRKAWPRASGRSSSAPWCAPARPRRSPLRAWSRATSIPGGVTLAGLGGSAASPWCPRSAAIALFFAGLSASARRPPRSCLHVEPLVTVGLPSPYSASRSGPRSWRAADWCSRLLALRAPDEPAVTSAVRRALRERPARRAGGAGGRGHARGRARHRGGARRGRSDRVLHGPQHAGAASEYDRPETIEDTAELVTAAGGVGIAVPVDHLDAGAGRGARAPDRRRAAAGSTCS